MLENAPNQGSFARWPFQHRKLRKMKFNSFYYLAFLSIVVFLYYLFGNRYRWALLLLASYYFYASWKPAYLFVIVGTTAV